MSYYKDDDGYSEKNIIYFYENGELIIKVISDSCIFSIPIKNLAIERIKKEEVYRNRDTETVYNELEEDITEKIYQGKDYIILINDFGGYYYESADSIYLNNFKGYLFYEKTGNKIEK